MAHRGDYDVAVILSQDQDFSEVADEIRVIAQERSRWIGPTTRNRRGINRTDWVPISRAMYDACLDRRDYRPIR
jgi:hypothetical protein